MAENKDFDLFLHFLGHILIANRPLSSNCRRSNVAGNRSRFYRTAQVLDVYFDRSTPRGLSYFLSRYRVPGLFLVNPSV
jgi:hypothetical protein